MSALLQVVAPVFAVVAAGYAAARAGMLGEASVDALTRFAQSFAIPCLLFGAISTMDLGAGFDPRLLASYYLPALACFALGGLGARLLFGRGAEDAVAIGFCCLFANSVLLGLPITERAFGAGALGPNYALVALNAPICYAAGIGAMEVARAGFGPGAMRRIAARSLGNAIVVAIALGLAVNLSGASLPRPAAEATEMLGRAGLPTALFALGGVLSRYSPRGDLRLVAMIALLSLGLHPALAWAAGAWANLAEGQMRSSVVTASMAPGVNAYLFATMYGRATRVAAASVLVCTVLSLATASLWLGALTD